MHRYSDLSCRLPSLSHFSTPKHTQIPPRVCLDNHDRALGMYAYMYCMWLRFPTYVHLCTDVPRGCPQTLLCPFTQKLPVMESGPAVEFCFKVEPCQCFHCRRWLKLLFQMALYQMPRCCERSHKWSLKLHHERNIGSEAEEGGNKRERNGVNHAASVYVSGYQVTYLTPRRWLEQKGELTFSLSFSLIHWLDSLYLSLYQSRSFCLCFLGCHYVSPSFLWFLLHFLLH